MSITVFVTGGTFDKEYNEISGELYFKDTHIREILELGRAQLEVKIKKLMLVDSLNMTEQDRAKTLKHCINEKTKHILITHGTDTMVNTAEKIAEKIKNKTIVLTGAMIPYAFGSSSDGFFNLGSALSFVQNLENGIYIAINGQCFDYDKVEKNKLRGYFEKK